MASFLWLHVCPWGQSWKVELHKHILREYNGSKKKEKLQTGSEGYRDLWQGRALWLHTPLEEIITLAGCLWLASVRGSLLSLRSPLRCVCGGLCVRVWTLLDPFNQLIALLIKMLIHLTHRLPNKGTKPIKKTKALSTSKKILIIINPAMKLLRIQIHA